MFGQRWYLGGWTLAVDTEQCCDAVTLQEQTLRLSTTVKYHYCITLLGYFTQCHTEVSVGGVVMM